MQKTILKCVLHYLLVTIITHQSNSENSEAKKTELKLKLKVKPDESGASDIPLKCPRKKKDWETSTKQSKLVHLIELHDIESTKECNLKDILSKTNNNLFFVESSGRNYLKPRDACAIESAVKNSGYAGHIIIAMTSPVINVMANNATCQLYTEHEGKNIFFRYVNVDTIFKDTPIHKLHIDGHLKHKKARKTTIQYRYKVCNK